MKPTQEYKVWMTDTDGSERLGGVFFAKSVGHARAIAKASGVKKITSIEIVVHLVHTETSKGKLK